VKLIKKYYEAIRKTKKDLTFSCMDKLGVLWDDKKRMEKF